MIVLRDADLERAANAAVWNGYGNGGQICISVERVYVEEPVYDEFVGQGRGEDARAAPGPARRDGSTWTSAPSRSRPRPRSSSAT